jgi:hypothetical protein
MKRARWHLKKMWSPSSNSPQSAQLPSDGPFLRATCSAEGSLPLISYQRKTGGLLFVKPR